MTREFVIEAMEQVIALAGVDDWQPEHYAELDAAAAVLSGEVRSFRNRQQAAKKAKVNRANREKVKHPGWFSEDQGRRAVLNRAMGRCEFVDGDGLRCGQRVVHVHHLAGRLGHDPHNPANLLGLCEPHHSWAHANVEAAKKLGLMRSRLRRTR